MFSIFSWGGGGENWGEPIFFVFFRSRLRELCIRGRRQVHSIVHDRLHLHVCVRAQVHEFPQRVPPQTPHASLQRVHGVGQRLRP